MHTGIPRLLPAPQARCCFWNSLCDGIRQWADYVNRYVAKGCRKTEAKPQAPGDDMVKDQRPFIRSGYHPTCCPCL